ncbi:hypothetical protein ABEV74_16360 [Paenibacillus cisolokensis]|uniref:hypothetical protein n=1 Tax=Paenibacillus cisolokensis TaxID=1658519 RepID=UPI003D26B028
MANIANTFFFIVLMFSPEEAHNPFFVRAAVSGSRIGLARLSSSIVAKTVFARHDPAANRGFRLTGHGALISIQT